jgi:hypothetical protein
MDNTNKTPTINEALEISKDWKTLTDARISESIEAMDTVSDVMLAEALHIKQEAFGDGSYEITNYEKKLMLSGFLLAQEMSARKMAADVEQALFSILLNKSESND